MKTIKFEVSVETEDYVSPHDLADLIDKVIRKADSTLYEAEIINYVKVIN